MRHSGLAGWPAVLLWTALCLLILANLAAYTHSHRGASAASPPVPPPSPEQLQARIDRLERQIALLKAQKAPNPLADYNEVYIDGKFAGFKKRDGLLRGIWSPGYVEQPVGETNTFGPMPVLPIR